MNNYLIGLTVLGLAVLGMAWMPNLSRRFQISYSIFYVFLGILFYAFLDALPEPNPTKENSITLRLTEIVVIVSLMGAGLKIDEPFSFQKWRIPIRLATITMFASIAVTTVLGFWWLGLALPSALLLGAVLAPTDPVLASDVQVGPPLEKTSSDIRFSLTAEGGLNDGMAFPFTWLAIAFALHTPNKEMLLDWVLHDLVFKIVVGLLSGFLFGKVLAYLIFTLPKKSKADNPEDGFVALAITFLAYGATELLGGYGFIAVFVCAITIRNSEMRHPYHLKMHEFTDQIERTLVAVVLLLFGGSIINGILSILTWAMVGFGVVTLLIIRPLCSYLSFFRSGLKRKEKLTISFFGIKGIGSLFYLSFALSEAPFEDGSILWCVVSFIILSSIVLHGLTATKVMNKTESQSR